MKMLSPGGESSVMYALKMKPMHVECCMLRNEDASKARCLSSTQDTVCKQGTSCSVFSCVGVCRCFGLCMIFCAYERQRKRERQMETEIPKEENRHWDV